MTDEKQLGASAWDVVEVHYLRGELVPAVEAGYGFHLGYVGIAFSLVRPAKVLCGNHPFPSFGRSLETFIPRANVGPMFLGQ